MSLLVIPALVLLVCVLILAYRILVVAPQDGALISNISAGLSMTADSMTRVPVPIIGIPVLLPDYQHSTIIRLPNPNKVLFRTRNGGMRVAKIVADCNGELALHRPGHKNKIFYRKAA